MDQKIIIIDGRTYKSVEEMPEDVRRNYENAMNQLDKNRDGMPDLLEDFNASADKNKDGMPDALAGAISNAFSSSTRIIVDGKVYDSLDDLPPDIRSRYDRAMEKMDADRNGLPDFLEEMVNAPNQTNSVATRFGNQTPRPSAPIPASPTMEPESTSGLALVLAVVLVLGLCAVGAIGVWYFFLR